MDIATVNVETTTSTTTTTTARTQVTSNPKPLLGQWFDASTHTPWTQLNHENITPSNYCTDNKLEAAKYWTIQILDSIDYLRRINFRED